MPNRKQYVWGLLALLIFYVLPVANAGSSTAQAASTPVINYPSGFAGSPSTIWLEAFAAYSGSSIHLVPHVVHNASNAWYKTPENVQSFSTTFTFHIVCPAAPTACGDGFGFMIIAAAPGGNPTYDPSHGKPGYTYGGFSSAQFSWSECESPFAPAGDYCFNNGTNGNTGSSLTQLPANILIKFDLINNAASVGSVVEGNLTGYYTDGEYPQAPYNPQFYMAPSGINIQSGHEFTGTITYDGTTLTENLTDTVSGAHYTKSYTANIPSTVLASSSNNFSAFIGFGGGTGAALDDVYIDSWIFSSGTSTPPPSAGPCDLNQDGLVNVADVQLTVNQVLGTTTCGTADLQSNGQCTAVDVQRVVNKALGGQCVTTP